MVKFAPNLFHLFADVPFLERFERASSAGFSAVEFPVAYEYDLSDVAAALKDNRLSLVAMNSPGGDFETQLGFACQPMLRTEFRQSIDLAVRWAVGLGRPLLHCVAGIAPAGEEAARLRDTYVDNLRYAARICAQHGITIVIEPISPQIRAGYFLASTAQALDVISDLGEPNVGLLFDVYQAAMSDEPILELLSAAAPVLKHVQIADAPGRGEPGTGELDFKAIFRTLNTLGYAGWIGLEYNPISETEAGLSWADALRQRGNHHSEVL